MKTSHLSMYPFQKISSNHDDIAQYFWSLDVELPFHILLFSQDGELAKCSKSTWHLCVCGAIRADFILLAV